ncbi:ABC transporter ATP-binding protein [Mycoplasmopsis agassizii]|uniref:ABC transporter ATP-binding protein n=1 Tax=Mycoplasmopsis agassizii TaxID=33922 RepID=A0ABX4H6M1_9BACT|nr:ABC transporter ATP-binding protein [Mycoplasmopsis agassizii]PAF55511.1 ABC transporter ATP-binding protein [Mycoplasmopsis agassizii]SMC18003.1 ABC-type multidrug transport system, ATPase and permease component [Mycoplasmopsis agassizii]
MKLLNYHRNAIYYLKVNFFISFLTLLVTISSAVFTALTSLFIDQLLSEIISSPNDFTVNIKIWLVVAVISAFINIVSILTKILLMRKLNIRIKESIKSDFQNYVSRLSFNNFKKIGSEKIFNWFNTDLNTLSITYLTYFDIVESVIQILALVIGFSLLPASSVIIAAAFVLGLAIISSVPFLFTKITKKYVLNQSKVFDKFFINVSKLVDNLAYLRLNFYIDKVVQKITDSNKKLYHAEVKKDSVLLLSDAVSDLVFLIYVSLLIGLTLGLIYVGRTTSNLELFLIPSVAIIASLQNSFDVGKQAVLVISNSIVQLKSRVAIINKWKEEFDQITLEDEAQKLEINSISFNNFKSPHVKTTKHSELNFALNDKVKKILIQGRNGIGKSTILNSLLKFNNDYSGQIKINNNDISKIDTSSIYNSLNYIDSHNIVLDLSIDENIAMSYDNLDKTKLLRVKSISKIDFELADKQNIEELSTGQKQRIDIARNLYRDNKILLLDEAFANIDRERAIEIEKSLLENKDLKMINISHNVSDEFADKYDLVLKL